MRKAGILLPISALPSDFGIGDLGENAYKFIDILSQMNIRIWQILPLNPVGYGNSPYQPYSSDAGEIRLISLEKLKEEGLITSEFNMGLFSKNKVDYDESLNYKISYLREACENLIKHEKLNEEYKIFEKNCKWLNSFAIYMALKENNNHRCWIYWDDNIKDINEISKETINEIKDKINFYKITQFFFMKQWSNLKKHANKHKIEIMGDIPIYVGLDSVDVWINKNVFLLDSDGNPKFVAGVPPDNFSSDGQRWGNPIYDWDFLKKTNFDFWIKRLKNNMEMFDVIRIDHFRAFDTYWAIPYESPTAEIGKWLEAPGYDFFDTVYEKIPELNIVVEDLGNIRPEVLKLRDHYNLKGMSIFQYNMTKGLKNINSQKNIILYTGTHDNNTLLGRYDLCSESEKNKINYEFEKMGYDGDFIDNSIKLCMENIAEIIILPVQDIIKQDDNFRINTPGTVGSPNWEYQLDTFDDLCKRIEFIKKLVKENKR